MRILLFIFFASAAWANNETYTQFYAQDLCKSGQNTVLLSAPEDGRNSTGLLQGSASAPYKLMNCTVTLRAPPGCNVVVSLARVDLRFKYLGACVDVLRVEDRTYCMDKVYPKEHQSILSQGSSVFIIFNTSNSSKDSIPSGSHGFVLSFTAVRKGPNCTLGHNPHLFACVPESDGTRVCIWNQLLCDGHNNCHNSSDEWDTSGGTCNPKSYVVLIIFLALLFVALAVAIGSYIIIKRRKRLQFYEAIL